MRRSIVVVAVLLALGACSSGGSRATSDSTSGSGASDRASTTSRPSTTTTVRTPSTTLPPDEGNHGPDAFVLPSGNIGCTLSAKGARCDIREHDWAAPPKPADCQFDYGGGVILDEGGAHVSCVSDTTLGTSAVLDYGQSAQRGKVRCDASEAGVRCVNLASRHGFALSRQSYDLF